ncbi:MAG: SpoIVB peptidase S55 [Silvibacterium sp.]
MQLYRKDIKSMTVSGAALLGLIFSGWTGCGPLLAQSVLDAAPAAGSPPVTTSFFPLSDVHRGLHGVAYTVFEGTRPEPMGVEVLGLLHNAIGPGEDMILARLVGAKPEYSGVVAGMSGSPVYIDGKLVGAIAYRIGEFSKEPICGITPIGQMLENRAQGSGIRDQNSLQQGNRDQSSGIRDQNSLQQGNKAQGSGLRAQVNVPRSALGDGDDSASDTFRAIDAPLVFSGFSPEAVALWRAHAPSLGLTPVAGIGGVGGGDGLSGMAPVADQHAIEPGSAVSAVLVRGDMEIAATCTVTYVDPTQLLACGHPITQFGPVSFPMTKADVVATLPSSYNAFKIINTGEMIGSFTEDRQTAIRGQFGLAAQMIPLTIHVTGDGGAEHTLHLQVVDQEQVTPAAVLVSVYQGLMESNAYAAETTYRVRGTVALKGYPAMRLDAMVAPSEAAPANLLAALVVGERFEQLYGNAARRTPVESIDIDVDALSGRRSMHLEDAQAEKTEVRGGDTVSIDATVLPWRGEVRNVRIPVTLPATLPAGEVRLLVSNGETVDRLMQPDVPSGPVLGVAATIAGLNSLHASDRLYVTLLAPEAQASMDGRTLTALPLSMANVLEPGRANHQVTLNGESAVPLGSVELGSVLDGEQVITLRVK